MRKIFTILALVLIACGAFAFFLLPVFWNPEPVVFFRMGIGTVIFVILFMLSVFIQLLLTAHNWGEEQSARKVTMEREESHRQFLLRLDHELKNPLTGLQAALANLHAAEDPTGTSAALDNASQAAARLRNILRDLRKLAELNSQLLEHLPVQVDELVSEMVSAAGSLPAYRGRSINLLVSKVPTLPPVKGDRDMLGLAFYNLLDNALKYSAPSDAVEVRVREDGRSLFIEVADGGEGVPAEEQSSIFDDLYRGENARETQGSGLGLALARRIVHLHRGEITLRSNPGQGRGTVFTIRLPVD